MKDDLDRSNRSPQITQTESVLPVFEDKLDFALICSVKFL